jgi:tetratricopeptide (TPR) repeat protein
LDAFRRFFNYSYRKVTNYRLSPFFRAIMTFVFAAAVASQDAQAGKRWSYVVKSDESLGEISTRLYGTVRMARKIALWNHLRSPNSIRPGQKLRLEVKPRYFGKSGDRQVLAMWRRRMGLEKDTASPKPAPVPAHFKESLQVAEAAESAEMKQDELSAETLLAQGEKLLEAGKTAEAYESFHRSRELNDEPPAPWFFEIRALDLLKRQDEAREVARKLADKHPELAMVPLVRNHLEPAQ